MTVVEVHLRESYRQKLLKLAALVIIPSASCRLKPIISLHTKNIKYIIWQLTPTNYPLSLSLKTVSTSVLGPVSMLALSHCHGALCSSDWSWQMQALLLSTPARTPAEVALQRNNKGFVFREADFWFECFPFSTFIQWAAAQASLRFF